MHRPSLVVVMVLVATLVTACSGASAPASPAPATTTTPATAASPTAAAAQGSPVPSATSGPAGPAPASPTPDAAGLAATPPPTAGQIAAAWADTELVDARSGETFRIADLAGKTVFIEPMAIWCISCRRFPGEAQAALDRLDREQVLYLSLDIDPSEDTEQLARYSEQLGFDWLFAVAPTSLAAALAEEFGDQVLNPPSTPLLLIRPDGTVELVGFGHRSADELVAIAGG